MTNERKNTEQELDLADVKRSLRSAISRTNDNFFDFILFLKRNIIIILLLLIAGVALGIYKDKTKLYTTKIYVTPNFGSVDYLYTQVEHLNAKIHDDDEAFFNGLGMSDNMVKIEVEPVVDIYKLVKKQDNNNYDLFKLMAENNDVSKVVEDEVTGKNYKRHLITLTSKGPADRAKFVDPLLKYLNNNPYFNVVQKEGLESLKQKIATTDSTLKQIDAILNDFSRSQAGSGSLMFYNDNTQPNELIKLKNDLVEEQAENKLDLINANTIISDSGTVLNDKYSKGLTGKMKFVIPVVFLFFFILINRMREYYRRQMRKRAIATA